MNRIQTAFLFSVVLVLWSSHLMTAVAVGDISLQVISSEAYLHSDRSLGNQISVSLIATLSCIVAISSPFLFSYFILLLARHYKNAYLYFANVTLPLLFFYE